MANKTPAPPPPPTPPSARKRGEELPVSAAAPQPKALPVDLIRGEEEPGTTPEALIQKRLHVGLPAHGTLKAEDAKDWADDMAFKLLPDAMAVIAWNLRNGDTKAQEKAVEQVLDMNGMRKREVEKGAAPTIILNLGQGGASAESLPWLKREDK